MGELEYDLVFSVKQFFYVLCSDTKFNEENLGQWKGEKGIVENNL